MKAVIALLCLAGVQIPLCAKDMTVRWKEVPQSLLAGRKVEVRLTGDAVLHGKAVAVTPDGLRMEITKVAKHGSEYGKGESLVPAGEISLVKVNRNHIRGRIILTSLFGAVTAAGTAVAVMESGGGTPTAGAVGVIVAFPALGYGLGWLLDRKSLTIHVVQ